MEKSDQKKVQYMKKTDWIDTRLSVEEMDFLIKIMAAPMGFEPMFSP